MKLKGKKGKRCKEREGVGEEVQSVGRVKVIVEEVVEEIMHRKITAKKGRNRLRREKPREEKRREGTSIEERKRN